MLHQQRIAVSEGVMIYLLGCRKVVAHLLVRLVLYYRLSRSSDFHIIQGWTLYDKFNLYATNLMPTHSLL